jgi:hypothetical protein
MMRTNKINISAYFSHPIRGKKGTTATVEDMALNNDMASMVARMLSQACPALDLYVPADNDEFVTESWLRGSTPEGEVLEIDKIILRRRDICIAFCYRGVTSNGMAIEIKDALARNIPVFTFSKVTDIPKLVEDILDWYYDKHVS